MASSSHCIDDQLRKAERNSKEQRRVTEIRKAFGQLDITLSGLLRRYGRKRKSHWKHPRQLELLREAIETIEFLEELKQMEGVESSTILTEATSTVPAAGRGSSGCSSVIIPVLPKHLEQVSF